jgi:hypothetical protein
MRNITVTVTDVDPIQQEALGKGGEPLRTLCQKEAESFDAFLRQWGESQPPDSIERDYASGLAPWEKTVIAGYIYQKILGRF